MRLSTKTRYGTRLMLELALNNHRGYVQLNEIAKNQDISEKYSEQIISQLKTAGLVLAQRGAQGGYQLSRAASGITLKDIVETLEGTSTLLDCLEDQAECSKSGRCSTQKVWQRLTDAINDTLEGITLEEMAQDCKKQSGTAVYEI